MISLAACIWYKKAKISREKFLAWKLSTKKLSVDLHRKAGPQGLSASPRHNKSLHNFPSFFSMKTSIISAVLLLSGTCLGTTVNDSDQKMYSEYFAYRPDALLEYIKKSKPWKAGRRDILDYGSGSGILASRLAEAGANSVTAVDISSNAVQAAKKRLEPFPNATARGTRPLQWTVACPPGIIGFRDRFDMVVSFKGALSKGTTPLPRIDPLTQAMKCAARATRDGGQVLVATFGYHYKVWLTLSYLVSLGMLAWRNESFSNTMAWKRDICIYLSTLPISGFNVSLMITARWISLLKKRVNGPLEFSVWPVLATIYSLCTIIEYSHALWLNYKTEKEQYASYEKSMADAGLKDIKRTRKFSLCPYEPLTKNNPLISLLCFGMNNVFYLANVNIYEGTKKSKRKSKGKP